ncbi:MAG TPA: hypothetical protein VFU15_04065 [Bacteroidia bacterium]|nr:hypothetical protein [Bacteroidia bacterium]
MDTKPISELHAEHTEWLNKLDFYNDELIMMRERIQNVAAKNTGKDILAKIEHFQNQIIVQRNNIDEFRHAIKDHENYLEHRIDENPVASDHRKVHDHPKLRETMESFEKIFNGIRHELNEFLAKVL